MSEKEMRFRLSDYEQPGLYLELDNGSRLTLTQKNIERITMEYWMDPEKIPKNVKDAVEFQRCTFCSLKGKKDLCDALRPILPLLDVVDNYNSFDRTTAIYKGDDENLFHSSYTTMQRALSYISNLSLISYCSVGRKYRKYFFNIIPIMRTEDIANNLYLNIYWNHRGEDRVVDDVISSLNKEMTQATNNQLKRLRLVSTNDAFINAFVLTHLTTELLHENRDKKLKERLARFESLQ